MSVRKTVPFLIFLACAFAGCAERLADFTVLSTKNVQLRQMEKGRRVSGEACASFSTPSLKDATNKAIGSGDGSGDMLIDGVITYTSGLFQDCILVEGTLVQSHPATAHASNDN